MKVFDILNEFIESKKHGVKLRTYLFYKQQANTYIKDNIGIIDINDLTQDDVDNFIVGLYEKYFRLFNKRKQDCSFYNIYLDCQQRTNKNVNDLS